MKTLFLCCDTDDHLASVLFDGLQDLLGEESVYDASSCPSLHLGSGDNPNSRIGGSRVGHKLTETGTDGNMSTPRVGGTREGRRLGDEGDFDLMVINACYQRDHADDWPFTLCERMRPGAKYAWVEGWDSAHEWHTPTLHVDACFRREIDPACKYPYHPHSLMFAAPRRWFAVNNDRPIDVFYAGNHSSNHHRWEVLSAMWQTKTKHRSIGASRGLDFDRYFSNLQQSKLAICPAGAADGDALRTWEAVAAGAIPIFVGYPVRTREPWFGPGMVCNCPTAADLPNMLDCILGEPEMIQPMRERLQAHALAKHTTLARVRQMLNVLGI